MKAPHWEVSKDLTKNQKIGFIKILFFPPTNSQMHSDVFGFAVVEATVGGLIQQTTQPLCLPIAIEFQQTHKLSL
ncbi:hypothetical protein DVA76_19650, partial [Acinetobacter baumannii]